MTVNDLKLKLEAYDGDTHVFIKVIDDDESLEARAEVIENYHLPKLSMLKGAIVITNKA